MADKVQPAATPQSTTSPLHPPNTSRSTSIPDDSETEFDPTPLHSPGGPQYEDLPPSYDFALSDARNGVASLDAAQIEAHRVSVNEGSDEPEVWEYRMRGGAAEDDQAQEHEDSPAYEGHVPVQHVANSENIPVGRVGCFHASASAGSRSTLTSDDPPHSVPELESNSEGTGSRGGYCNQTWTPFGAPGHGPFGAHGNCPFESIGHNSFGRGRGFGERGGGRRSGRGHCGHQARSGSSQDWAAFGQNMGRLGEEFGRRMGNWGEHFGRQAAAMGEQIGRQADAMGQQIGRDAGSWATAYGGRATTSQTTSFAGPSNTEVREPPQYDEPPSYQGSTGAANQETGVLHGDHKFDTYPPEKRPQSSPKEPVQKTVGKQKAIDDDEDEDDDSSISSESSSSSSSSDSETDDYDEAQATFLRRIESINKAAEAAATKGKKSREEIEHERDLAIEKATREKEETELKIARKQSRRMQQRQLRDRRRALTREYREKKREMRVQSNGKGKGKAKKGADRRELKREYKAKRRALKRERKDARRHWKRERRDGGSTYMQDPSGERAEQKVLNEKS